MDDAIRKHVDHPEVLDYRRPDNPPPELRQRGPASLVTVLVLGSLGACMILAPFIVPGLRSSLLAPPGGMLLLAAIFIWEIDRNW